MKNFVIKILTGALDLFSDIIVTRIPSEWVKQLVSMTTKRLLLFGEALTDSDPNNKEQVERIAKETLLSPEFQELEKQLTLNLIEKIPNPKLGKVILDTDALRLQLFATLGDNDPNNAEQLKATFEAFLKSEEFDSMAITFAELLAEKYAKNPATQQFIVGLVTSLVNSDDTN